MKNTYASDLTSDARKRTLMVMKTVRTTNLRKSLYETLEILKKDREPVEIVLGGETVAVLMPSPTLKSRKRKPLIDLDALSAFCKKYQVKSISLFGSILRDDFDEKSDVDVIIDPIPIDRFINFHEECLMVDDLETIFGRKVDMLERRNVPGIRPYIRQEIEATARIIYEASSCDENPQN